MARRKRAFNKLKSWYERQNIRIEKMLLRKIKKAIMIGESSVYFEDTEINAGAVPKGFAQ